MSGFGYRSHGAPSSGRRRTRRSGGRGGRGRGGSGHRRETREEPRVVAQCPPELKEPFVAARDFVAGLVGALGLPARLSYGGVEPARDGRQVTIQIRSLGDSGSGDDEDNDLGVLIGKHGAMLEALTALTNAVMHHHDCEGVFFSIDVGGYRARRVATLRSVAHRAAERALRDGVAIELSPMPPAERRIVHMALADHPDLSTQSTGVGMNRRVVIVPRGAAPIDDEEAPEEEPL